MNEKNLSFRQVSYLTGVSRSTLNDIANGKIPRIDVLEDIAKGLNIRIRDIVESDYM